MASVAFVGLGKMGIGMASRLLDAGHHDRNIVFTAALRLKDVEYALRLAQGLRMSVPFGELAEGGLTKLCEGGRAQVNESSIFEVAASRLS